MHKIKIWWYQGIRVLDSAAEPWANATCDFTHRCIAAKSDCRFFDVIWCITTVVLIFCPGSSTTKEFSRQISKSSLQLEVPGKVWARTISDAALDCQDNQNHCVLSTQPNKHMQKYRGVTGPICSGCATDTELEFSAEFAQIQMSGYM